MKFNINKNELVKELRNVKSVVTTSNVNDVLDNLKFTVAMDHILVVGSNEEVTICNNIAKNEDNDLEIIETGKFLVDAKLFSKIINKLSGKVQLAIRDDKLSIKANHSTFHLAIKNADFYPKLQEISGNSILIKGSQLKELVAHTEFSATNNLNANPVLRGINFVVSEHMIKSMATDSHVLSKHFISFNNNLLDNADADNLQANVPAKNIKQVVNIFDNDKETISMQFMDNMLVLRDAKTVVYLVTLNGNYPSFQTVLRTFNESYDSYLEVDSKELLHTLQRGALISHLSETNIIDLFLSKDKVNISKENGKSLGTFNETLVNANYHGQDMKISFNPDFVINQLKHCELDNVELEFDSNNVAAKNGYCIKPFIMFQKRLNLLHQDNMENANYQITTPVIRG